MSMLYIQLKQLNLIGTFEIRNIDTGSFLSLVGGEAETSKSDLGVDSLWVWEPRSNDSFWGWIRPRNLHHMSLHVYGCEYPSGTDRINEKCKVKLGQTMDNYDYLWRRLNNQIVSRRADHRKSPFVLGENSESGVIAIRAAKREEYNSDWSLTKVDSG